MGVYKVIGKKGKEVITNVLIHPGELLREELDARRILQREFAETIGLFASHLSDLIKGKRNMSAVIALKIQKALKIDARIWMRLQMQFDLVTARKKLKRE